MTKKALFLSAVALGLLVTGVAHAQSASAPVVTTQNTPNGSSVTVAFPSGYSGEVTSTYNGTNWTTTTKPLSQSDIDAMNQQFEAQQQALDQLFAAQEAFFEQQQAYFDNLWKGIN